MPERTINGLLLQIPTAGVPTHEVPQVSMNKEGDSWVRQERQAYAAIFAARIYSRVLVGMKPQEEELLYPTVAQIDNIAQKRSQYFAIQLLSEKVHRVFPAIHDEFLTQTAQEEKFLKDLPQDNVLRSVYERLLSILAVMNHKFSGSQLDPERKNRSLFFNYIAGGFVALTHNSEALLVKIIPEKYEQKHHRIANAATVVRVAAKNFGVLHGVASSDARALGRVGHPTLDDYSLSDEELLVISDKYKKDLHQENMQHKERGCPFRRSGILLEPFVGQAFLPNPLRHSFDYSIALVRGNFSTNTVEKEVKLNTP